MIEREITPCVKAVFKKYPVVTITGPRQSGKTTLVKHLFGDRPYVNLEQLENREFARSDPRGFLQALQKGAVIDEIQRVPELLSDIQALVDERAIRIDARHQSIPGRPNGRSEASPFQSL
jgi:predicted AAA+ superfamily ATPase